MQFTRLSKLIFILALACLSSLTMTAQVIEISPQSYYHFGGELDVREGQLSLDNSVSYGLTASGAFRDDYKIEFQWLRQDTELDFRRRLEPESDYFDIAVEYFHLGIVRELDLDNFQPYMSFKLGMVLFSPQEGDFSSETRFSGGLTAGAKYFLSDNFGLRFETGMLLPFQWGSAGIFCGTNGCGTNVGGSTTIIQGIVGGGIILAY
jgi:hypothetical protein